MAVRQLAEGPHLAAEEGGAVKEERREKFAGHF